MSLPFTLDHALSSAALHFKRREFSTYILETKVPGLHLDVQDDEEKLPISSVLPVGRPRIVDGTPEAHVIAGLLHNGEGRDSDNTVMKILEKQDMLSIVMVIERVYDWLSGEEKMFTGDEPGDVVSDEISHYQCLEFLCNPRPHFLMKDLNDKETICSVLLDMAEHVKVLPPGNEPLPWDVLDMTLCKDALCELVEEMKTVEGKSSASLMGSSGVYVLTTSPYSALLRALEADIADAAVKMTTNSLAPPCCCIQSMTSVV